MRNDSRSRQELVEELNSLRRENEELKRAISPRNNDTPVDPINGPSTKYTILVVDDNKNTRSIVAAMVKKLGYSPIMASTPDEAINNLIKTNKKIDLVISDIVMPEGDGSDMIEQILKIKPDLKVIFMSGYAEDEIVHDSVYKIQNSYRAFMKKPFSLGTLQTLLHKQLNE